MVNEMLKDALDIVEKQKNLIAKTGNADNLHKFTDMITELQELIEKLEAKYGDYVFSLSGYEDYHYIDINIYHVSEDGISRMIVYDILNTELDYCSLFWVQPYNEGLTFKFHI